MNPLVSRLVPSVERRQNPRARASRITLVSGKMPYILRLRSILRQKMQKLARTFDTKKVLNKIFTSNFFSLGTNIDCLDVHAAKILTICPILFEKSWSKTKTLLKIFQVAVLRVCAHAGLHKPKRNGFSSEWVRQMRIEISSQDI